MDSGVEKSSFVLICSVAYRLKAAFFIWISLESIRIMFVLRYFSYFAVAS